MAAMLRFAPSPNGPLHLGHALSALINEAMAATLGRPLTLRMEDIDATRCRPEHEASILSDLAWLGVTFDGPVRRQSTRFAAYGDALDRLRSAGLAYPSFVTRREIAEHARHGIARDPDGAPRVAGDAAILGEAETARRRRSGEPVAWRLDMDKAAHAAGPWTEIDREARSEAPAFLDPLAWGDVVLARKDVPTSYHLSVVVDDAHEGVSHVVRGEDLYAATAIHRVLQTLLDLPAPRYHHHGLVLDDDGRKLSKSTGALGLAALRAAGETPRDVRARALGGEVSLRRGQSTSRTLRSKPPSSA